MHWGWEGLFSSLPRAPCPIYLFLSGTSFFPPLVKLLFYPPRMPAPCKPSVTEQRWTPESQMLHGEQLGQDREWLGLTHGALLLGGRGQGRPGSPSR